MHKCLESRRCRGQVGSNDMKEQSIIRAGRISMINQVRVPCDSDGEGVATLDESRIQRLYHKPPSEAQDTPKTPKRSVEQTVGRHSGNAVG